MLESLIGWAAATLTTLSFIPQALKILRERQSAGVSLGMYLAFGTGVALWLAYGVLTGQSHIIVANAITLSLVVVIIVLKLRLG